MTDSPPDQATDQAATHTIADAARLLGISEHAVRKRIHRGTLPAHKDDDRWLVAIPVQAADQSPASTDLAAVITPLAVLTERLTAQHRELTEAAPIWQTRAAHLEEQLKQLAASPAADAGEDARQRPQESPVTRAPARWPRMVPRRDGAADGGR